MKLLKNAITVLEKRYISRDENGGPLENVEGLFRRVAKAVAAADLSYDAAADISQTENEFFDMMTNLEFLPNSPTLMNAGKELGQLSACFVLPVGDSMEEIFEAVKQAALIHKSGGGTGFSFSRLRPKGSSVKSTGGVASGPVSFMKVFNTATEAVKQGGTRRGANMGILRADHPDILDFIDCKSNNLDITNFNISVGVTEEFMKAAERGEEYPLIDPSTGKTVGMLDARMVFDKIVDSAWKNGEPGIIFLDRLNRDNAVPSMGEIESTNPCGEQPLLPYESCNLGSINLAVMIKQVSGKAEVDYDKLGGVIKKAVHFLDNVIEVNRYPLEIIERTTKLTRKIGLGVMGFADMLLNLGIPYNSDEAVALGGQIMKFINDEGHAASVGLAKERGAFPVFEQSIYRDGEPLRNATVTTIAPTGTLSIIAGCSSGIEPVFAFAYFRNIMDNTEMIEISPVLRGVLEARGLYTDEMTRSIIDMGTLSRIDDIPDDIRRVFVCSHDVSPEYHIRMQAAFQQYTDNAVSKTVNFPNHASRDDVRKIYGLAYTLGCKGTTIYRDGSREGQTLNIAGTGKKGDQSEQTGIHAGIKPRDRSESMLGLTKRVAIGCGNLYVTVNYDDHGICEVFTSTGKAGGCPSQSEATARLASIALRSGIDIDYVVKQMRGIRCPSTVSRSGMKCTSCPDAIARVIKEADANLKKGGLAANVQSPPEDERKDSRCCPECSEILEHEGGCVSCRNCGYSKCG